jgi:hypothetical protein
LRWSVLVLAIVVVPAIAFGKPKLAVAPLEGDSDGAIADVVAGEASEHGKTTKPEKVSREMEKLDLQSLSGKSVKKLRTKLGVDVVIHGSVDKDGGKKHLVLMLSGNGKATLDVDFRTTKDLKKALASKLGAKIERASSGSGSGERDDDDDGDKRESPLRGHNSDDEDDDDDGDRKRRDREAEERKRRDDEEAEKKKRRDEEERKRREEEEAAAEKKKRREDEERKRREEEEDRKGAFRGGDKKKSKRTASRDDDEDESVRRRSDDDDEDEDTGRKRKKKRRRDDDDNERVRHPLSQAAAWADAGAGFARRTLTYTGGGMKPPPPVGTAAPAAQIEAELYPGSFSTLKGPAASIGIAGAFDRELALGIAVPGTTVVTPIKSGYYWFGARYRFTFGPHSIAVGASYWRRTYMADRSKLMMPEQLDMPDVDYTAIAPDITARFAGSPKLGVFASVQLPLMLNSGPIQANTSYGPSTILAFDVRSGVQYAFGAHYALQVALGFDQIGFKFGAKQGTMAAAREVSAATDRSIGLSATLGVMY